jgi:tetratricopeptide (TPR) repeat protein
LAALAVAGRLRDPSTERTAVSDSSIGRGAMVVCAALTSVLTLASFLPPWLAARYVQQATASWRAHPEAAYAALDRARRLDFLSDTPDVYAGAIATRRGEWARARASFSRAIERNPHNWYAQLELAVLEAMDNQDAAARARLRVADRLNPLEPLIDLALKRIRAGEGITVAELDEVLRQRVENRFGLNR